MDYFNPTPLQLTPGTVARAVDINAITNAVDTAFSAVQTGIQNRSDSYAVGSGSASTYTTTLSPAPTAYTVGMEVIFKANHENTGAATLNVNGLGAVAIKTAAGAALTTAYIPNGAMVAAKYDGTNFQITLLVAPASNANFSGCKVYKTTTQNIPNGSITLIQFATANAAELYDTHGIHSLTTNDERLTVPAGASKVRVKAMINFSGNATGIRKVQIKKNGLTTGIPGGYRLKDNLGTSVEPVFIDIGVVLASEGDYFTVEATQSSGGDLAISGGGSGGESWFELEVME